MASGSAALCAVARGARLQPGRWSATSLCWAAMGVASTLALSTPSSIALAQVAGPGARRAIAMLAIIGGFASTVFWPLSGALDVARGLARHAAGLCRDPSLRLRCPSICWCCRSRPPAHHLAAAATPGAERRAARDPLARLPAAVADALHRRLRVHRRHGAHDRDPARARPSRRLGGAAGLADRPGPGHACACSSCCSAIATRS